MKTVAVVVLLSLPPAPPPVALPDPPLSDLVCFPSRDVARDARKFQEDHASWLELHYCLGLLTWGEWADWRTELRGSQEAWSYLATAQDESSQAECRRHCLGELRTQLGYERYYRGVMPDVAPWWRFRPMDP